VTMQTRRVRGPIGILKERKIRKIDLVIRPSQLTNLAPEAKGNIIRTKRWF